MSAIAHFQAWRKARRLKKIQDSYGSLEAMRADFLAMQERAAAFDRERAAFDALSFTQREAAALAKVGVVHTGSIVGKECVLTYTEFGSSQDFHTTILGVDASLYRVSLKLASLPRGGGHTLDYDKDDGWYFYYYQPGPIAMSGRTECLRGIKLDIIN